MSKNIILLFALFFFGESLYCSEFYWSISTRKGKSAYEINKIQLSSTLTLEFEKSLFHQTKNGHLLGDGFECAIVQFDNDNFFKLTDHFKNLWKKGPLPPYDNLKSITWFIRQHVEAYGALESIEKISSIKNIFESSSVKFLTQNLKYNSSKRLLSNAQLYVISPAQRILYVFRGDT